MEIPGCSSNDFKRSIQIRSSWWDRNIDFSTLEITGFRSSRMEKVATVAFKDSSGWIFPVDDASRRPIRAGWALLTVAERANRH
jgi:hypothetical protein